MPHYQIQLVHKSKPIAICFMCYSAGITCHRVIYVLQLHSLWVNGSNCPLSLFIFYCTKIQSILFLLFVLDNRRMLFYDDEKLKMFRIEYPASWDTVNGINPLDNLHFYVLVKAFEGMDYGISKFLTLIKFNEITISVNLFRFEWRLLMLTVGLKPHRESPLPHINSISNDNNNKNSNNNNSKNSSNLFIRFYYDNWEIPMTKSWVL